MIQVGINENVVLDKVEITDKEKGTIAFTWRKAVEGEKKEVSAFEALAGDGYVETGSADGLTLRLFAPMEPYLETTDGKLISPADRTKQAADSIGEKKNIMYQIASTYMTADKVKFDIHRGTGLTLENYDEKIVTKPVLEKLMCNLGEDFIALMQPFLGKDSEAVRLLLVRQSKTKHYADFRQKFVRDNPFIESMKVPLEASKLKFTKHELTNGLDNPTPAGISQADAEAEKEEAISAASVFGG